MKTNGFHESAEMYLKTVSELAGGDSPVPVSALARRLGIGHVAASEMVRRLQDQGLLTHLPYKGVRLTAEGERRATAIVRSHRLWECFLVDCLGMPWEDAHAQACRLEHAGSLEVTEALAAYLHYPEVCPHGNPIPHAENDPGAVPGVSLLSLRPGCSAILDRVHPETDELLAYLAGLPLRPGMGLTLCEIGPFGDVIVLLVEGRTQYIGREAAAYLYVRDVAGASAQESDI